MDDIDLNKMLDMIAAGLRSAESRNVVHACRPRHPMNHKFQWRNLLQYAVVANITPRQERFVRAMADAEWKTALENASKCQQMTPAQLQTHIITYHAGNRSAFARAIGVTYRQVLRYLDGTTDPIPKVVELACEAFESRQAAASP